MYADERPAWLLKALRETAEELASQLAVMPDDGGPAVAQDEWSLREVAGHLRDCERLYLERLERMVYEDEPDIPAFDAESIEPETPYAEQEPFVMLREFAALRRRTVMLLRSLDDGEWERKGRHPYRGVITISEVVREMNEHDLEHLWQARRIREGAGGL